MRKALTALFLVGALAACGDSDREDASPAQSPAGAGSTGGPAPQADARPGATLAAVRARGWLSCGVNEGLAGFAFRDNRGRWSGFDADFCRATAAAVLGDENAARFQAVASRDRLAVLTAGKVDVLWRNTSWTFSRDAAGVDFVGVNYYDGQGFMAPRALAVGSVTELNGARICVQSASTTELNLADYFRSKGLDYDGVVVDSEELARASYGREACDAFTSDVSALAAARTTMQNPTAHVILPEVISKEPLGPAVRHGDDQWADIVRWTLYALILAEELGVTSQNAEQMRSSSTNPEIRRLLGVEGDMGARVGLRPDWAYQAIRRVGNYGEIFDRNVGRQSPMKLERGLNALWTSGGLMYAPPMR